jgi:hypothetical protein
VHLVGPLRHAASRDETLRIFWPNRGTNLMGLEKTMAAVVLEPT